MQRNLALFALFCLGLPLAVFVALDFDREIENVIIYCSVTSGLGLVVTKALIPR